MKLRVARHTSQLQPLIHFYTAILGLEVIGGFNDHAGYNGIFIGGENAAWHLEFTESPEPPLHQSDEDDLLVFYVHVEEYNSIIEKATQNNVKRVVSKNPYWEEIGITLLDPDGFRIVISLEKI